MVGAANPWSLGRGGSRSRGGVLPARAMAHFADWSRTRGSGLGLAICYLLVDVLGRSVTVESTVGVGVAFTVRLSVWG